MSERPKNFERSWRILEYLRANSDAEHCVTRAEMLRDPVMQHYVAGKETFNDAIFNMALAMNCDESGMVRPQEEWKITYQAFQEKYSGTDNETETEDVEEKEYYDGQVFPEYHYKGEGLLSVSAEYKDKREYLYLPAEPEAITKALHRLGAENPEDCTYHMHRFYSVEGLEWMGRFEEMLQRENIFEVNSVAEKLNDWDMDLNKLDGIVRYAGDDSVKTILKLAEYLDEFEFVERAENYEDVGQYAVDITFGSGIPDELEEHIDLNSVGRHMEEEYEGRFVKGGFVYNNKKRCIEEVLEDARELKIR